MPDPVSEFCRVEKLITHERELREMWQGLHLKMHTAEVIDRVTAKTEIDRRLEGMNELRAQIQTERGSYVTRDMFGQQHDSLRGEVFVRFKAL